MRKLVIILIALTLSVALVLGSCAKPAPAPSPTPTPKPAPAATPTPAPKPTPAATPTPAAEKPKEPYGWPKPISIGSVSLKGTFYPCASGWAELAKKYYGISVTPEVTGGSAANVDLLDKKQIEIGFVSPDVTIDAVRGKGDYAGKKVNLRVMLRGHGQIFQLMTLAKSGIKTPADMNGKTYMYNMKGSPPNISFGEALIEAYKLTGVKPLTMTGTEDSIYAVGDGKADVGQTMSYGSAALVETALTKDMYFISLSPEAQKYICSKLLWLEPMVIPKGTYRGVDSDVPTVGYLVGLYSLESTPDDLVYMMTKAVLDHLDEFAKYHVRAKDWSVQGSLVAPVAPFHNGAIRYYKEKGVWTPQMEELQKKLLADVGATK